MSRLIIPTDRPPIFIGAGVLKEPERFAQLEGDVNLAAAVAGTFTSKENYPNGTHKVEYWDQAKGAYYNCFRFTNPGREAASRYLPDSLKTLKDSGILGLISIGTMFGQDPLEVLPDMAEWALEMGADGVEINGSCRNLDEYYRMMCMDTEGSRAVYESVRARVGHAATLGFKVAPMTGAQIYRYSMADIGWDYYASVNTIGNKHAPINPATRKPFIEVNSGLAGLSGPSITDEARANSLNWVLALGDKADVLSIGGLDSVYGDPNEMYTRVREDEVKMVGGAQEFRRAENLRDVVTRWAMQYAMAEARYS